MMLVDEMRKLRIDSIRSKMTEKEKQMLEDILQRIRDAAVKGNGTLEVDSDELTPCIQNVLYSEGFDIDYWDVCRPVIDWEWEVVRHGKGSD